MNTQHGGPAFPPSIAYQDKGEYRPYHGMTLRDYFAGQALAIVSAPCSDASLAAWCYQIADAMLAEREKGKTP